MVDRSKVNTILEDIEKYLKELKSLLPVKLKDLERNIERRYSLVKKFVGELIKKLE